MLFGGETAQSYYEEGLTSAIKGDLDQALLYFRRALQLDDQLHQARHQIGRCLLRQGKAEEALPSLDKAARALAEVSAPRVDLGFAFLQLGRIEAARDIFAGLLQEKPNEARAVLGLAYCACGKGQWETALGLAQRAIELGRTQFDTHFLIARAADKVNRVDISTAHYQKAEELMNQSIEASPDHPAGYYLRARVHHGLGRYTAALDDIENALKYVRPGQRYAAYNELFSQEEIVAYKESLLVELNASDKLRGGAG
jgi:tetratricopeptide (TPR) repeat protein